VGCCEHGCAPSLSKKNSRLAEDLLASEEGLCPMKLISSFWNLLEIKIKKNNQLLVPDLLQTYLRVANFSNSGCRSKGLRISVGRGARANEAVTHVLPNPEIYFDIVFNI
jgi:hypothetical protein